MADFNFFLNRQGARGQKGEQGEQGFSPIITVGTNTLSEYTLLIQTQDSSFETVNLREHKEDLGGTYIRYNRDTGVMYAGDVDNATTEGLGVVRFATDAEAQAGSEETVITPAQVDSKIDELDNEIQTDLLSYVQRTELSAYALKTDLNNYVPTSQLSSLVDLASTQNISGRKNFRGGIGVTNLVGLQDGFYILPYSQGSYPTFSVATFDTISLAAREVKIGKDDYGKIVLDSDNRDLEVTANSFTIRRSGRINDNIDSGNIENYLPIATTSDVGVVKPDGTTITVDSDGTLHGSSTYTLPTASTTTLGGVKVDGTTITIDSNGVISSQGGGSTYTAGNGINITNDEISVDTSVIATKSSVDSIISGLSNYMDLSSAQTSTGRKTFSNGIATRTLYSSGNSLMLADGSNGETFVGGTGANSIVVLRSPNRGVRVDRNGGSYTNIDTGNLDTELGNSTVIADKVDASELTDISELYPTLGGLAMPSNVYTDLTLGASGTTYTAPASGYYYVRMSSMGTNQYFRFMVKDPNNSSNVLYATRLMRPNSGSYADLYIPIYKGYILAVEYTATGIEVFRFLYAVGSESEA